MYLFFDHSRVHVGNLSDGKLGGNLGRDDSLCARIREGPLNTMNGHCRVAPHVGQQVHLTEIIRHQRQSSSLSAREHEDQSGIRNSLPCCCTWAGWALSCSCSCPRQTECPGTSSIPHLTRGPQPPWSQGPGSYHWGWSVCLQQCLDGLIKYIYYGFISSVIILKDG